ncbi:hypothetical protein MBLNU459_g3488t3 [Dothideomycetes sp. NU459]
MQLPKLTPLQSRFVVSLTASIALLVIYYFLWTPTFAYAAELHRPGDAGGQLIAGYDEHPQLAQSDYDNNNDNNNNNNNDNDNDNEDDSPGNEQARRAEVVANTLGQNNVPGNLNIEPGKSQVWLYPNTTLYGNFTDKGKGLPSNVGASTVDAVADGSQDETKHREIRQDRASRTVYISINTCLQPTWNASGLQAAAPPQLTLYVSNSSSNTDPGPNVTTDTQITLPLVQGFANFSLNATADIYMSVSAPDLPENFTGVWNYNLAASIDGYYHSYNPAPFLYLIDTDTNAALLVTDNVTQANSSSTVYQEWMNLTSPFIVFAHPAGDMALEGVRNSFCGLQTTPAQIMANPGDPGGNTNDVQMGMITRGLGNKPKEQFYIKNLNGSSAYYAILAMQGNSTAAGPGIVGGGGQVWQSVNYQTKSDGNCALIFNLSFCDEVAYAVPSNPYTYPSISSLSAIYDEYAGQLYQNFSYSLQQIPCNTTSSAQYSLAKNCDDCAAAYKQWLCAVTMPRCEDYSSQLPWLQKRNVGQRFLNSSSNRPDFLSQQLLDTPYNPMPSAPGDSAAFAQTYGSTFATNSSRNPAIIDDTIMPGPYNEVLPCDDLCYSLMQSCPASFGFGCPFPGRGLEADYGTRSTSGEVTCSYLGAYYYFNAAGRFRADAVLAVSVAAAMGLVVAVGGLW